MPNAVSRYPQGYSTAWSSQHEQRRPVSEVHLMQVQHEYAPMSSTQRAHLAHGGLCKAGGQRGAAQALAHQHERLKVLQPFRLQTQHIPI